MPAEPWPPRSTNAPAPRKETALLVEDLFLLDDLKALGITWVDRLVDGFTTHQDVERVWMQIRCWGPGPEDAVGVSGSSTHPSQLKEDADKLRNLVRLIETWDV
jgi:hypothetical protein